VSAGSCSSPTAIIIEPARDLAEQTAACLHDYCRVLPSIKVQCFIGSSDSRRGRDMLDCHIAGAKLCAGLAVVCWLRLLRLTARLQWQLPADC
jgi:superfamily II DNA/RNA helicase